MNEESKHSTEEITRVPDFSLSDVDTDENILKILLAIAEGLFNENIAKEQKFFIDKYEIEILLSRNFKAYEEMDELISKCLKEDRT